MNPTPTPTQRVELFRANKHMEWDEMCDGNFEFPSHHFDLYSQLATELEAAQADNAKLLELQKQVG
jgi:hypothetical protein